MPIAKHSGSVAVESRRDRLRTATYAEIKHLARRQMAENGAASLSLRNIAGQMGLTTPALYRYFANRDALKMPKSL